LSGWGARSSATNEQRHNRPQPARPVGAHDHRLRTSSATIAPNRLARLGRKIIGYEPPRPHRAAESQRLHATRIPPRPRQPAADSQPHPGSPPTRTNRVSGTRLGDSSWTRWDKSGRRTARGRRSPRASTTPAAGLGRHHRRRTRSRWIFFRPGRLEESWQRRV
jgi:hypothetical protein